MAFTEPNRFNLTVTNRTVTSIPLSADITTDILECSALGSSWSLDPIQPDSLDAPDDVKWSLLVTNSDDPVDLKDYNPDFAKNQLITDGIYSYAESIPFKNFAIKIEVGANTTGTIELVVFREI